LDRCRQIVLIPVVFILVASIRSTVVMFPVVIFAMVRSAVIAVSTPFAVALAMIGIVVIFALFLSIVFVVFVVRYDYGAIGRWGGRRNEPTHSHTSQHKHDRDQQTKETDCS
jgi:hypothetical protein